MPARRKKIKRKPRDTSVSKSGRVTRCTHAVIDSMCAAIATGAYIETAAEHTGIIRRRFYEWLRQGAKDEEEGVESIFRTMRERTSVAMSEAELANLEVIRLHAEGYPLEIEKTVTTQDASGKVIDTKTTHECRIKRSWTAAAWRLERQHPERWALRRTNINFDGGELDKAAAQIYMPAKDELPEAVVQQRRAMSIAQSALKAVASPIPLPPLEPPPREAGNGRNGGNGARS